MSEETAINFTKRALDALPLPAPGKRAAYRDTRTPGLQVRVTSTGVKTFTVFRRVNGKPERVTLGRYPDMTIEQARRKAAEVNALISKGTSPAAMKRRVKREAKTLAEAFADYQEARKDLKPLTVKDMARAIRETFPDWQDKPLAKITPAMVEERHREFGQRRSEARANLGMRYLRAIFNFARARYKDEEGRPLIGENPGSVGNAGVVSRGPAADRHQAA